MDHAFKRGSLKNKTRTVAVTDVHKNVAAVTRGYGKFLLRCTRDVSSLYTVFGLATAYDTEKVYTSSARVVKRIDEVHKVDAKDFAHSEVTESANNSRLRSRCHSPCPFGTKKGNS